MLGEHSTTELHSGGLFIGFLVWIISCNFVNQELLKQHLLAIPEIRNQSKGGLFN